MKFNPDQPPFWEKDGGPITDNINTYKRLREYNNINERRIKIIEKLYEYDFGSKKHLLDIKTIRIIKKLKDKLLILDNKIKSNNLMKV